MFCYKYKKVSPIIKNTCCICKELKKKLISCDHKNCKAKICNNCLPNFRKFNKALVCPLCNQETNVFIIDVNTSDEKKNEDNKIKINILMSYFCRDIKKILFISFLFLIFTSLCFISGGFFLIILGFNLNNVNVIIWFLVGLLLNILLVFIFYTCKYIICKKLCS